MVFSNYVYMEIPTAWTVGPWKETQSFTLKFRLLIIYSVKSQNALYSVKNEQTGDGNYHFYVGWFCVRSSTLCPPCFAIILLGKRELVAFFFTLIASWCGLPVSVPWIVLQCVSVVFPDHTHLPFRWWKRFWSEGCFFSDMVPRLWHF